MRPQHATVATIIVILGFAAAAAAFTFNDGLASFADDSVSYLVMARWFSPFREPTAAIALVYPDETNYPPAFALVLALTGGAYDLRMAHLTVVACVAAALWAGFLWFRRETGSPLLGALLVLLLVSMPVVWMNIHGILSEGLYLFATLLFVLLYEKWRASDDLSVRRLMILGAVLAVAVLTRNAAVALIGAWCIVTFFGAPTGRRRIVSYAPAIIASLALLAWWMLRPSGLSGLYANIIAGLVGESAAPDAGPWAVLLPQLQALYPAWASSFLMYWIDAWTAREAVVLCLGLFALCGLVRRLAQWRIDAWYVLLYLTLIAMWPTALQMQRFIFAIMPFLLLHMVDGASWLASRLPAPHTAAVAVLVGTLAVVTAPALGFFYFRFHADTDARHRYIAEYYRVPELPDAREKAARHRALFDDMEAIARATPPDSVIAWYMPGYIALLAERAAVLMPPTDTPAAFFDYLERHHVDYIFLSRLHPRETLDTEVLNRWREYFNGFAAPVWTRFEGQQTASVLLAIDPEALAGRAHAARRQEAE